MLVGTKELRQLGYTETLIRQMSHAKGSPFFRTGKKWWVHLEDLKDFEKEQGNDRNCKNRI